VDAVGEGARKAAGEGAGEAQSSGHVAMAVRVGNRLTARVDERVGCRRRQVLLEHLLRGISALSDPRHALLLLIGDKDASEAVPVRRGVGVELLAEQHVRGARVEAEQGHPRLVRRVAEDLVQHLDHGGDACSDSGTSAAGAKHEWGVSAVPLRLRGEECSCGVVTWVSMLCVLSDPFLQPAFRYVPIYWPRI